MLNARSAHTGYLTLTLKPPITTAADSIHKYFFFVFQRKEDLKFQVNPLLWQRIHMKNQALFSLKDKSKKLKCCLLQFLFGTLWINRHLCPSRVIIMVVLLLRIIFTPSRATTILVVFLMNLCFSMFIIMSVFS